MNAGSVGSKLTVAAMPEKLETRAVVVDPTHLRAVLVRACAHASLDAADVVAWIVDAPQPTGATPIAYLHPRGVVRDDTVRIFRAVGAARASAYEGTAHRLALWRRLPALPEAALGPIVRHELAHAVRWQRSGTSFYEADERLRRAVANAESYAELPTEREANAAAGAFARAELSADELAQLAAIDALTDLLAAHPARDVVGETLALLGEDVHVAPGELAPRAGGLVVEVVTPAPASAGMP
jgi:hypothetical protein